MGLLKITYSCSQTNEILAGPLGLLWSGCSYERSLAGPKGQSDTQSCASQMGCVELERGLQEGVAEGIFGGGEGVAKGVYRGGEGVAGGCFGVGRGLRREL